MKAIETIDFRYWVPLLVAAVIIGLIGSWSLIEYNRLTNERINDTLRFWKTSMVRLQQEINYEFQHGDIIEAQSLISDYAVDENLIALAVIDENQQVVLATRYAWKSKPAEQVLPVYEIKPEITGMELHLGMLLHDTEHHHIHAYYPVTLQADSDTYLASKNGMLYMYYDMESDLEHVRNGIWKDAQYMFVLGVAGIVLLIGFMHRYVSQPLNLLTQASRDIAKGQFTHVPLLGKGELVLLANTFNQMSGQLQQSLSEIKKKEELIRLATHAGGIGTWEWHLENDRVIWSEDIERIFGLQKGTFGDNAKVYKQRIHPDDIGILETAIDNAKQKGTSQQIEHRILWPDGSEHWVETQGNIEYDEHGKPRLMRGTVMDITQRKHAQEEIERLAYFDPLTGLANRRLLLDRMQQAIAGAQRNGLCGALIFLDLDRFKVLNDSLGHKAGDLLLQQVANRLSTSMRKEDTVSRLGGDEFVVLLPANDMDTIVTAHQASRVVDKIRQLLQSRFDLEGHTFYISASIGVAIYPQDGNQAEILLNHADAAMYQAKGHGRNTTAFYHASLQARADARLSLEESLHHALEREEMVLFYQAQVDNKQNTVGIEALVRWQQPDQSIVPPNEFIPVAEESGLILRLGHWVLLTACKQLRQWQDDKGIVTPQVSVNVSPVQFRHSDFVDSVAKVIKQSTIDPRLLTLEITEGTLIENLEDTIAKLQALKDLGVRISIDDFGTGYSSLYYLKHLPLDELKIDKAYVQDISLDKNNAAIVETILSMARHLQLEVVAEGVETEEQAEFLMQNGCERFQGFLYSRPAAVEDITRKLMTVTNNSNEPPQSVSK